MLERRRRALKKSEPPILVALRMKKNMKTCLSVMCDNMSSCMHGIKGWVFFFILKHLLQRLPFTPDNSQASLCLPVSFSSIYTFIHLPVTACVRQSMKKLLRLGLVSQCWGPPSYAPLPSLPFCFLPSVERLCMMGSPKAPPSPRSPCGSGSVPALVIDPSGPSGTSNSGLNRITAKETAARPPQTGREKREKEEEEALLLLTISSFCQRLSSGSQVSTSSRLGKYQVLHVGNLGHILEQRARKSVFLASYQQPNRIGSKWAL